MRDCPQERSGPGTRVAGRGVNRQVTTVESSLQEGTHVGHREHLAHYLFPDNEMESVGPWTGGNRLVSSQPGCVLGDGTRQGNKQPFYLLSPESDSDSDVRRVRIADRGSKPQYADVQIENIPARGVIDSGSDITIMGGELFKYVATIARLRKSKFRKPDKIPKTYDGRTFTLDGVIDLDITFSGVTMKTPVYVKQSNCVRAAPPW